MRREGDTSLETLVDVAQHLRKTGNERNFFGRIRASVLSRKFIELILSSRPARSEASAVEGTPRQPTRPAPLAFRYSTYFRDSTLGQYRRTKSEFSSMKIVASALRREPPGSCEFAKILGQEVQKKMRPRPATWAASLVSATPAGLTALSGEV